MVREQHILDGQFLEERKRADQATEVSKLGHANVRQRQTGNLSEDKEAQTEVRRIAYDVMALATVSEDQVPQGG